MGFKVNKEIKGYKVEYVRINAININFRADFRDVTKENIPEEIKIKEYIPEEMKTKVSILFYKNKTSRDITDANFIDFENFSLEGAFNTRADCYKELKKHDYFIVATDL